MGVSRQSVDASGSVVLALEEDTISLPQIFRSLKRGWKAILIAALVCGGATSLSWLIRKPIYAGQFQLLLSEPPAILQGPSRGQNELQTQVEVLEGEAIMLPIYNQAKQKYPDKISNFSDFRKSIRLSLSRNTRILTVSAKLNSPELSIFVLSQLNSRFLIYGSEYFLNEFQKNLFLIDGQVQKEQRIGSPDEVIDALEARRKELLNLKENGFEWQTVTPPSVGEMPVEPKKTLELFISLLVGIVSGAGFVLVRDRQSGLILDPGVVKPIYSGPILMCLPCQESESNSQLQSLKILTKIQGNLAPFISARLPLSNEFAGKIVRDWGELGHKSLLLDLSIRSENMGFWDLVEYSNLDLDSMIQPLSEQSYLLLGGSIKVDPVKLVRETRTQEVLEYLKVNFDYILIVFPPLLPNPWAFQLVQKIPECIWTLKLGEDTLVDQKQMLEILPIHPQMLIVC